MTRFKSLLPVVTLVLIVAGCASASTPNSPDDPLADHSFLNQQPCAAPCWYGLKPDQSSVSDVLTTLNKLPFVDPATVGKFSSGRDDTTNIAFTCLHTKSTECSGIFTFTQGKLKGLTFHAPYQLTFQTMVDKLGSPDYIDYELFDHRQPIACWIQLAWYSKGVYLGNFDPANDRECRIIQESGLVSPNVVATEVTYTGGATSESGLNDHFSGTPWRGFAEQ
jgi:hypothetical protein